MNFQPPVGHTISACDDAGTAKHASVATFQNAMRGTPIDDPSPGERELLDNARSLQKNAGLLVD